MEINEMQIENRILECLKDIPFMKVNILRDFNLSSFYRPDLVLEIANPTTSERLIVCELKNNGQPRLARLAVDQLLRCVQNIPQAYPVFAAPYISPRSAEICREQGVGYIDLAGNCRLTFDNIYILKEGKENPYNVKRDLRSLFSPKAERILRVLLSSPNTKWKTKKLAETSRVSLGQVSNVKKLLVDREWIDPSDFRLKEPGRLLEEWSIAYRSERSKRIDYYSFEKINELESSIAEKCEDMSITYAMTGFSAAARRIPMVRYQRAAVYISNDVEPLVESLGLKKVASGANLSIWTPYDNGVLFGTEEVEGIRLVSAVQNYLDLKGDRGRGEEAAAALLEGVIKKLW
ncbi:MAG: type IV toxin-antitoxin system AbiEi family antitoxin [Syntrophomonadaceae bacterium]|nr:type IV toxin-antitoxin system AbiEi family antitoxin [Syntrophomonadaceae bacterium]